MVVTHAKFQQGGVLRTPQADTCLERRVKGCLCCSILLEGELHIPQVKAGPRAGRVDLDSCLKASLRIFVAPPACSHTLS